jgi:hypothetical protein
MFGRRKGGDKDEPKAKRPRKEAGPKAKRFRQEDEPKAKRPRKEAEPKNLSWAAEDSLAGSDLDEEFEEEPLDEDELEPDEIDAEFEDEDFEDEDEEEGPTLAERQAALREELERQAEEFGLTNLDPKSTYGPNGDEVAAIVDALDEMSIRRAERLADAWAAIDPAERDLVERDIRRRHREGVHSYELTSAEDAISAWLSRQLADEDTDAELWRLVADAATGAAQALILDTELDDVDYDTLYTPWSDVMGSNEPDDE